MLAKQLAIATSLFMATEALQLEALATFYTEDDCEALAAGFYDDMPEYFKEELRQECKKYERDDIIQFQAMYDVCASPMVSRHTNFKCTCKAA